MFSKLNVALVAELEFSDTVVDTFLRYPLGGELGAYSVGSLGGLVYR